MPKAYVMFGNSKSLICRLYRVVTGSPWSHVAIGDGDVVDDWAFGRMYVEQDKYEDKCWWIDLVLEVPLTRPIEIASLPKDPNQTHLKAILAGTDCVGRVKSILSTGGLDVPAEVRTPSQLWDWLRTKGGVARAPGDRQED